MALACPLGARPSLSQGLCLVGKNQSASEFGCDFMVAESGAPMSARVGAMERLRGEGVDVRYVIVGRQGWSANALARRTVSHPEFGRRLFWLKDASDAELRDLYERARSLIFASIAEGFGLAMIEQGASFHHLCGIR